MAAPLGYKDFTTGEVLTANDVDGYLMQGIWVFANATARDAAVTSPQEGNACYLKDTDTILVYSGSTWATQSASNPISANIVDAKGDLIAATAADTVSRLAVGANNTVLTADSSTATGLKWAAGASSGLTLIARTSFTGAATQSFNSVFSSTYDNYLVKIVLDANTTAGAQIGIRLRASGTDVTSATYVRQQLLGFGTSVAATRGTGETSWAEVVYVDSAANSYAFADITFFSPFLTKITRATSLAGPDFASSTQSTVKVAAYGNSNATSYDGFTLIPASGSMNGTVYIYGMANA